MIFFKTLIIFLNLYISSGLLFQKYSPRFNQIINDQIDKSACKNNLKSFVTSVICACFILPHNSYASDASKLYFEAETAIKESEDNFKILRKDWDSTKKLLDSNFKLSAKSNDLILNLNNLLNEADTKLALAVTDGDSSKISLETLVESQIKSTVDKYAIAEASSTAQERPAITAKKFKDAKNSDLVSSRENLSLKTVGSSLEKASIESSKLKDIIKNVIEAETYISKGRELQSESLLDMDKGINNVYSACKDSLYFCSSKDQNGVNMFDQGVQKLSKVNDKEFSKALTDLKIDDNSVKSIDKSLASLIDLLQLAEKDIQAWEEETKLSAKNGKSSINLLVGKLNAAIKSIETLDSKFEKNIEELNLLIEKDKSGYKSSKSTLVTLKTAESGARRAESKLKSAKEAGDKEASTYLKKSAKVKTILNAKSSGPGSLSSGTTAGVISNAGGGGISSNKT